MQTETGQVERGQAEWFLEYFCLPASCLNEHILMIRMFRSLLQRQHCRSADTTRAPKIGRVPGPLCHPWNVIVAPSLRLLSPNSKTSGRQRAEESAKSRPRPRPRVADPLYRSWRPNSCSLKSSPNRLVRRCYCRVVCEK